MNTLLRPLAALLLLVTISVSSCKYEEGPDFSLRTKKSRLANSWKIQNYYEDGVDKTADALNYYYNFLMVLDKDGNYTLTYRPLNITNYAESGTWEFVQSKEAVLFTKVSPSSDVSTWKILRLKNDELWGQYTRSSDNVRVEFHLKGE